MAVLDDADRIWNRACDPFASHTTDGDRALQALLGVHGQVMNGGLVSALEYIGPEEIHTAVAGFWYFRLDDAARALVDAVDVAFPGGADPEARGDHIDALDDDVHERLEQIEDNYYAALPQDDVLEAAFRERLRETPGDFAPLD
jgi:hypothetical protein